MKITFQLSSQLSKLILFSLSLVFFCSTAHAQFGTKVYKNAPSGTNNTLEWINDEALLTGTSSGQVFQLTLKNGTYAKQKDFSGSAVNDLEYIIGNKLVGAHGNAVKGINNDLSLPGHTVATHVFQNDFANYFVTGGKDGKVILWDREYKVINTIEAHTQPILSLTSSPDGKLFASSAADNSVKIWEAATGAMVKTFTSSKNQITALEFTKDGSYLIGGTSSGGVVGWLTDSWERGFVTRALNTGINSLSVSRDDKYLVCGSDAGTMSLIYLSRESKDKISFGEAYKQVAFNPSGTKLAGLAANGEVHIYDCTGLKVEEGVYPGGAESASLEITEFTVVEKNEDGVIDASDEPKLLIKLLNKGKGYAVGLNSNIAIEPAIAGMSVDNKIALNGVAPGAEETIIVPINVNNSLATSSKSYITAKFSEKGGAQSNTGKFKLNTLSAKDIAAKMQADAEAKKQAELEAAYKKAMEQGDASMSASKWDDAIASFNKALSLKKGDSAAQKKLDAAQKAKEEELAAKKAEMEALANAKKYEETIKKADGLLAAKKFDDAIASYKEAQTLNPKESYPKSQIAQAEFAKEAGIVNANYLAKLGEGDKLLAANKFDDAIDIYEAAKKIKKGDPQADKKIASATDLKTKAEAAKIENDFVAKLAEGDKLLAAKKFDDAISVYESAEKIKKGDARIATKIKSATDLKATAEAAKIENDFVAKLAEGDKLVTAKKWDDAIDVYRSADKIKKGDTRIDSKIASVTQLKEAELAKMAEAEKKKKMEAEFASHMAKANELKSTKKWDDAIAKYEDALKVKNGNDQALASIEEIKKAKKAEAEAIALAEAKRKEEEAKRKEEEAKKKAEAEAAALAQKERIEAERKKIEEEKKAKALALAAEKAEAEAKAKEEALAVQAEKERLAQLKLEESRKRKEEEARKAEEEKKAKALALAAEKAKEEEKALATQAEKERIAQLKLEESRKRNEEAKLAEAEKLAKIEAAKKAKAIEEAAQKSKIDAETQAKKEADEAARLALEKKKKEELAIAAERKKQAERQAALAKQAAENEAKKTSAVSSVESSATKGSLEDRIAQAKTVAESDARAKGLSEREIELAILRAEMQERKTQANEARKAVDQEVASTNTKSQDQLNAEKEALKKQRLQEEKMRLAEQKRKEEATKLAQDEELKRKLAEEKRAELAKQEAMKAEAAKNQRERILAEQKRAEEEKLAIAQAQKELLAKQRLEESRKRKEEEANLLAARQKAEAEQRKFEMEAEAAKKELAAQKAATAKTATISQPATSSSVTNNTSTNTNDADAKRQAALALIQGQNAEAKSRAELENKMRFETQKAKLAQTIIKVRNEKAGESLYGLSAFVEEEPVNMAGLDVDKEPLAGTLSNVARMSPIIFTIQLENKGIENLDKLRIEYDIPDKVLGLTGLKSEVESFTKGDTRTDKIKFFSLNEHPGDTIDVNVKFFSNNAVKPSLTKKYTIRFGEKLSVTN